ncbi:MAG: signal peptidase II, partial [Actinomycetota bacterium]|nr:signal peptidase II [Actinomycetota bacterium]
MSRDEPVRRGHRVSRRSARRARSLVVVVAAGAAALDQVGERVLAVHEAGAVLGPVHVVLTHNPGLAFGTLAGHPGLARLIDLGTSVLLLVLGIRLSRETSAGTRVLWGLLLGGALGNAVDRFGSAGVVDWLRVAGYPAAFNLSDVFVRMSGVGLATLLLRHGSGTARGG